MLNVRHALYCVDGCFFVFYVFDSLSYCFDFSGPRSPHFQKKGFRFFVKIQVLICSKLKL